MSDQGDQHRLSRIGLDHAGGHRLGEQQETELAAVRQDDGDPQGDVRWPAQNRGDQRQERRLAEEEDGHPGQQRERRGADDREIDLHADGDEEQPDQHVPERADVVLDLMPEVGFADDHPSQERADRRRQPCAMGGKCRAEREGQRGQQEQLAGPRVGSPGQSRPKQRPGDHGNDDEGCSREDELVDEHQTAEALVLSRVHQDQERQRRQILEQQNADREAAVLAAELAVVRQLLERDRGRRHRDHAADHERGLPAEAERDRGGGADQRRETDLQAAGAEDGRAGGDQLRQRELEPDHEHQEHDAELGEKLRALARRENPEAMRADREAGREVADDRRQPGAPREADRAGGGEDDDQGLGQERIRQRPRSPAECARIRSIRAGSESGGAPGSGPVRRTSAGGAGWPGCTTIQPGGSLAGNDWALASSTGSLTASSAGGRAGSSTSRALFMRHPPCLRRLIRSRSQPAPPASVRGPAPSRRCRPRSSRPRSARSGRPARTASSSGCCGSDSGRRARAPRRC